MTESEGVDYAALYPPLDGLPPAEAALRLEKVLQALDEVVRLRQEQIALMLELKTALQVERAVAIRGGDRSHIERPRLDPRYRSPQELRRYAAKNAATADPSVLDWIKRVRQAWDASPLPDPPLYSEALMKDGSVVVFEQLVFVHRPPKK